MNLTKLRSNAYEIFITTLFVLGIPAIAWIYVDWRAAFASFVLVNIVLGVLYLRGKA